MKTPKRRLEDKLDKLWSEKIRSIGKCEVCGETGYLNAHHIIGRLNKIVRWDLKNGVCLCAGCHTFRRLSAHQDPEYFHDWLVEHKPDVLVYLQTKRYKLKQWSVPELEKLLKVLQSK
jgi:hypothetical protein